MLASSGALLLATCSLAAGLLLSREASADQLAIPCEEDPFYCQFAPISYDMVDALPIEWSFDTGWVPQSSPLQVHIWAGVYANTRVSLKGAYVTTWEAEQAPTLFLSTPGAPNGGMLAFHYGAELGAQAAVHVSVLGQKFDWVGDIPYVPQFDFQVYGKGQFDAWAFPPGVALSGQTQKQTLAQVGIGDIIGGSIPGIDGGFQLDVAMELTATYSTKQIVMVEVENNPVAGGPITSQDGMSHMTYSGGPYTEVDVHPEGTVDYDGTLHLIPAFYVELLGQSWSIPIVDIPISFPITQTEWVFDPVRVHTPLPDLVLPVKELDFGKVEVGQKNLEAFDLTNAGEGKLAVAMAGDSDVFELWDTSLEIKAGQTVQSAFRFVPKQAGEFKATVLVSSNDPDAPLQQVILKGTGVDGPPLIIDTDEPPTGSGSEDIEEAAGCACRTGQDTGSGSSGLALIGLGLVAAALRGRSRSKPRA